MRCTKDDKNMPILLKCVCKECMPVLHDILALRPEIKALEAIKLPKIEPLDVTPPHIPEREFSGHSLTRAVERGPSGHSLGFKLERDNIGQPTGFAIDRDTMGHPILGNSGLNRGPIRDVQVNIPINDLLFPKPPIR